MPRKVRAGQSIAVASISLRSFTNGQDNNTPAVRALHRENQRRARARQKDLVEDLQRRLLAYEQAGVQATLSMQAAAQAVAAENQGLRSLLAQRGVTGVEIEEFLQNKRASQAVNLQSPSETHQSTVEATHIRSQCSTSSRTPSNRPPAELDDLQQPLTLQRRTPPPPRTHMHCDEAASIVADVHGHGDVTLARSALGCTTTDCSVRTTQVFTIIDNAT